MREASCGYIHDSSGSDKLVSFGPQLIVDLGFDPDYMASLGKAPRPDIRGLVALIDTGATESYIDSALANEYSFPPIDLDQAVIPGGKVSVMVHLAQIHVLALSFVLYGRLGAIDLESSGLNCQVLLGRTFLQNFEFFYHGPSGNAVIRHP